MEIENDFLYQSKQRLWEQKACVKKNSRITIEVVQASFNLYPKDRIPILIHPLLRDMAADKKEWLIVQSLYKYLHDIAYIETDIVITICNELINCEKNYQLPYALRSDLLTVIVDEGYHAYVAMDFMQQVMAQTNIEPIHMPGMIELRLALNEVGSTIDENLNKELRYIAVCLAENTITKDLATIKGTEHINPAFFQIVSDHMLDEGRHALIFSALLNVLWQQMSEPKKMQLIQILPKFIDRYLNISIQKQFDINILNHINIKDTDINQIISDTYKSNSISTTIGDLHPMRRNIYSILDRAGIHLVENRI